jgi:hypothetical protein
MEKEKSERYEDIEKIAKYQSRQNENKKRLLLNFLSGLSLL